MEASLPPDALFGAEAVFLSNSLGLRAVATLDDLVAGLNRRTR